MQKFCMRYFYWSTT